MLGYPAGHHPRVQENVSPLTPWESDTGGPARVSGGSTGSWGQRKELILGSSPPLG